MYSVLSKFFHKSVNKWDFLKIINLQKFFDRNRRFFWLFRLEQFSAEILDRASEKFAALLYLFPRLTIPPFCHDFFLESTPSFFSFQFFYFFNCYDHQPIFLQEKNKEYETFHYVFLEVSLVFDTIFSVLLKTWKKRSKIENEFVKLLRTFFK